MKSEKQLNIEHYDHFCRDQKIKKFYQSAQWRQVKEMKLARNPCCETCEQAEAGRTVKADMVHHILKLTTPEGWEHRLDITFLSSACHACHNQIESEMEKDVNKQ